jgi:hypothetical protein
LSVAKSHSCAAANAGLEKWGQSITTTIIGPTVHWITKPPPLRPSVLTPFGLRPHYVSTDDQPKTLSLRVVQRMGYSQTLPAFTSMCA